MCPRLCEPRARARHDESPKPLALLLSRFRAPAPSYARCLAPKGRHTQPHMNTVPHPGKKIERLFAGGLSALGLLSVLAQPVRAQATHTAQDWAHSPADLVQQDSLTDYLGRLRSALLALKDRPEQQQPLKLTATSTAESRSGVRRLRIRNFQLLSDGARPTAEYNLGPVLGRRSSACWAARWPRTS
jgi:hypothetical protein